MGKVQDLQHEEGLTKMKDLIKSSGICHLLTGLTSFPLSTRPMATQQVDDEGNVWFFSGRTSDKNTDIEADNRVQLLYANHDASEYLSVYGTAEIVTDRAKAEELWTPMAKAWFTEGIDDPELTMIKVRPEDVYYWDTKSNKLVSLFKIIASVLSGKTDDDGVKGSITV